MLPQVKKDKKMSREDYELEFSPQQITATADLEEIVWNFTDNAKKFLRAVSVINHQRLIEVELISRERAGGSWRSDVRIKVGPTHPRRHNSLSQIFTWNGDLPFKGEIRAHAYGNTAGDTLTAAIMYEEKV